MLAQVNDPHDHDMGSNLYNLLLSHGVVEDSAGDIREYSKTHCYNCTFTAKIKLPLFLLSCEKNIQGKRKSLLTQCGDIIF